MKVSQILQESVSLSTLISKMGQDVTISYTTDEKLSGGKKNEMQGRITKIVNDLPVQLVGTGGEYQADRRKEAGQEEFQAGPRKWGVRRDDGIIEHNGELYIEYISRGRGQIYYLLDGSPIDKSDVIGLAPPTPSDIKTNTIVRTVKVRNIVAIK